MDRTTNKSENDVFRMEKSVITKENTKQLTSFSEDKIPEALLYHICYEHQYNIFGFGRIDPTQFGRRFGFSLRYLREKHDNPYQKIILNITDNKNNSRRHRVEMPVVKQMYETRLENALFILMHMPLTINSTVVDDDKRLVRKILPVHIFKSLYVEQDKTTGKITYAYELDEGFRRNLSTYYQMTNIQSIVRLRKSGGGILYQFLLRLRDALYAEGKTSTDPENTPKFAYLCTLGEINANQEPKYMKRDLNALLKKIQTNTELDFDIEWIRDGSGERYTPLFHFNPHLGDIITDASSRYATMLHSNERTDVAYVEFMHNTIDLCPFRTYENIDNAEELFVNWIKKDTPEHKKLLESALISSLIKTYRNINCPIPSDTKARIDQFISRMKNTDIDELENCVKEIFDSRSLKPHPNQ